MNPTFKISNNYYSFVFPNGFEYDIAKTNCETPEQLTQWVDHLKEKNWFSLELERELKSAL